MIEKRCYPCKGTGVVVVLKECSKCFYGNGRAYRIVGFCRNCRFEIHHCSACNGYGKIFIKERE